ncbi:ArsR/SmtB family transcription factor [Streptomyces sp. 1331.2]|uniref:ArsR/SmtB family transcription factor n=1 Tax=Streptomyces sp. 1331.2 TaxID=1938835 RepID=UPI000BDDB7EC|nr:winged helix-turn-helix domain-containing protein [Streptomyces sp. 1331.2]SOB81266.1 DNA-binding transcriptional regulator, ArsR family [Streptomyces sp. 1331.2]
MQRVHFTGTDLARVRLQSSLGPLLEGVFALRLLTRPWPADVNVRWSVAVRNALRGSTRAALPVPLTRGAENVPLRLLERPAHEEAAQRAPGAGEEDTRLALDMWRAGVAPYWGRMLQRLEAVCDAHGRIAAAGGVEQLLSTLHPRISWKAPVLEVDDGPDLDVALDGRGLVLKPSVFLPGETGRVVTRERDSGQTVLVFSAAPELVAGWDDAPVADGHGGAEGESQALSALVGQTRAAALRVLTDTSTNSQLAARLGVTPGVASRHAAVLRETGLISTRRVGSSALHTVTPLGMALLGRQSRRVVPFTSSVA